MIGSDYKDKVRNQYRTRIEEESYDIYKEFGKEKILL